MKAERRVRLLVLTLVIALSMAAPAFQPIPKESAKALGVTRGKPFSSGLVFVDGKYIEPPYVVERWGTGIRINQTPVTGQLISWNEFLKTQDGVKVEKRTAAPAEAAPAPEPATESAASASASVDMSSLDDLFNDDPKPEKPKKTSAAPAASRPAAARAATKPSVTYALAGAFKPNEASKALVKRINASRTEIDRVLRSGGFICFGSNYSRVTGDNRILQTLLDALPELQQRSETVEAFCAGVRSAGLVFLHDVLCRDLFKNRIDYRKLKERRDRINSDRKWSRILNGGGDPAF